MAKELLSDLKIKAWIKKPHGTSLHDGGGLYLRLRSSGAYWSLRQINPLTGMRTWASLMPKQPYPEASLANARKAASDARALTGQHTDLVRDKKAKLSARRAKEASEALEAQRRLTMRQVFDRWASSELTPHIGGDGKRIGRKDGGQYVREQFERRVFPALGNIPIANVHKADVLAILDAVKGEGKLRTANVLLADLKQMFRFAAEREIIGHSPIELVSKRKVGGKDVKRERFLSNDELSALAKKLPSAKLSKHTELGISIILATGCRVGELMGAVWADSRLQEKELQSTVDAHNLAQKSGAVQLGFVDLKESTWYMPTTKNQRDHLIHLSDFAVKQFAQLASLRRLDKTTGKRLAWVFPNSLGTGPVCVKSFGKQLADRQREETERLANRTRSVDALVMAGGRWTAHDLRRTTSTVMSQLGISGDVINECQNHIKQGMSSVYIQDRRLNEQAHAFNILGAKLNQLFSVAQAMAAA